LRLVKLLVPTAVVTIAGCTVGPDYHAPNVHVPQSFDATPATLPTTQPVTTSGPNTQPTASAAAPMDLAHWWRSLNDPELDSLLSRAIDANLDLQIAVARLQEVREAEAVATGNSLPSAEFSAAAARGSGTNSTKGRVSGPLNAGTNTTGLHEITQVIGFDASWEVDLFGHLRREAEAVTADTQAAGYYRNQVLVTLLADVARSYIEVRSLQLRLDLARLTIDVAQKTADIARVKFNRGMVTQLDVVLAERQLATVQSRIAPLEAQLAEMQRRVAVLLGKYPEALRAELSATGPLPNPPTEVKTGLPGDLLRRRPDIRQAESQLVAANARIGVATSLLYPQIVLTGGAGWQGQGLGREPVNWMDIWSVGPALRWPLLDFGSLDASIQAQDFRTQQMLLNYRRTIIAAIQEVDNALTNYDAERARLADLSRAVDAGRQAFDLASKRYDRGLTDFLNVLDAQRQLFDLQDQYAVSEDQTVTQFIAVCKALGGGWEGFAPPPPPRAPLPAIVAAGSDALSGPHGPLDRAPSP
jgi:NodT family efflux transporter outer membrane factor (OMF) lipoprotein